MPARILIVEDTTHNLELMRYLLEARGHSVIGVTSGGEGIAHAREGEVDLIILDLQLADSTGFEVLQEMRVLPHLGTVPMIAVTAFAMVGDRDKVLSAGFDGYVAKPLEPQVFAEVMESFLPESLRGSDAGRKHQAARAAKSDDAQADHNREASQMATILVVDDRGENINLARGLLEPSGYEVLSAASVEGALSVLEVRRPDLLMCDIHLADGNTLDTFERLQGDSRIADVPILFHTATASPEDMRRVEDLGGHFLLRPVDPAILLGTVRSILSETMPSETGEG